MHRPPDLKGSTVSETVEVVYVGPHAEVEVEWAGGWITAARGVPIAVPRILAEGGTTDQGTIDAETGESVSSQIGGLLEQYDIWQPAKKTAGKKDDASV